MDPNSLESGTLHKTNGIWGFAIVYHSLGPSSWKMVSNSSKSPRPYRKTLSCHCPYSHRSMHEPCIALPEMFSRFSTKCKDFNTQCFLLFTSHSKDINKIPLTIFLFSRRAPDYTGLLPFITLCAVQSYNSPTANSLAQAFWEVFDHPVSAADYALSF